MKIRIDHHYDRDYERRNPFWSREFYARSPFDLLRRRGVPVDTLWWHGTVAPELAAAVYGFIEGDDRGEYLVALKVD